jgi:uncharacterized protein (TIGR03435 family)
MTDLVVRKLHFTRKLLLNLAGWLTVTALALFGLVDAAQSPAQSPTENKTQSIADTWQGTLHAGQDLRTVVKITRADDGGYKAVFYSIDQGGDVMDRPVIDQTGLAGRYDFALNWTPDDSQFGGMPGKMPPPTDNTNPPPNLYTAIQEQIGLKLDATKAPADVMVIDHVEKPSEN